MKNTLPFLITLFSFCSLYAQNISSPVQSEHVFSWDGSYGTESFQVNLASTTEMNHFIPVWTGNGLDQMNINVVMATFDGADLGPGDEIAVFDGNLCVGMGKLSTIIDFQHMLNIKTSRDDGSGNGYTTGHPIVYKFWDQSADKEIEIISSFYYSNDPGWSASGNYVIDGISFVKLTGMLFGTQSINFTCGWNIFSVYLTPDSLNMKTIFKPLINDGSLVKVQDEKGNSLEDYGYFGGWTNNIGNIDLTEGYKAKVTKDCQLQLEGVLTGLPYNIPVKAGWNIIGYPSQVETNGMSLVQPLVYRKTLVKVQTEKGDAIEDYGIFGGWTNNIGNFKPGEGYKVKVTADEILTLYGPSEIQVPAVTTSAPDSITSTSALLGGEVTNEGGSPVTERGICYGTTQTPTILGNKVLMGNGTGIFKGKVTGLTATKTYFARAYAVNSRGVVYGEQVTYNANPNPTGTFTDSRDNKTYKWVKIGSHVWMAENLAWLPSVSPPEVESHTAPYYYVHSYYGTDVLAAKATAIYSTYGVLYNWPAAMNGAATSSAYPSGVQGACPAGWHLPSDTEWRVLTDYLINNGYGFEGSGDDIAKSVASTTNWDYSPSPNPGTPANDPASNNSSGFSGLPGSLRNFGSYGYNPIAYEGVWWSSTEALVPEGTYYMAKIMWLGRGSSSFPKPLTQAGEQECGCSIRCLKDF